VRHRHPDQLPEFYPLIDLSFGPDAQLLQCLEPILYVPNIDVDRFIVGEHLVGNPLTSVVAGSEECLPTPGFAKRLKVGVGVRI